LSNKNSRSDLALIIRSQVPLIVIESHEEKEVLAIIRRISRQMQQPAFSWTVTEGLVHQDGQGHMMEVAEARLITPEAVLKKIKSLRTPAIYVLIDFHPYLKDTPQVVRLIKEIALGHDYLGHTIVLLSHQLELQFFGETERNLRKSLQMAEVMAPCVLWIDEIEKGIATGDYDSGTSKRVLGTFLTWMAERKKEVFIVATSNDISSLPPELIRKGRLDEIFFVDLPDKEARQEIFRIHFSKRDLQPDEFDLQRLADETAGFTGAEIEQAIVSTLYRVRSNGESLITELIIAEIRKTSPLSVVMAEKIEELREWAALRCVRAN